MLNNYLVYDPNRSFILQLKAVPGQRLCDKCWPDHIKKGGVIVYKDDKVDHIPLKIGSKLFYISMKATKVYTKNKESWYQENLYSMRDQNMEICLTDVPYRDLLKRIEEIFTLKHL